MIVGINGSKLLTKNILCECKCNLTVEKTTRIKSGMTINIGVRAKIRINKKHVKKVIFGILLHVAVKR